MASRLLFTPRYDRVGVDIREIKFEYYSGFATVQKQKSIESLHNACKTLGYNNILEISSKSPNSLGVALSAFNLATETVQKKKRFTVEQAFQSSKVFEYGGPYTDLLEKTSRDAKKDLRLKNSGKLIYFLFYNVHYDLNPTTSFYDWLYINVLLKKENLVGQLKDYDSFTDIEFNQKKSLNCQAYSVALFKSLQNINIDLKSLKDISELKNIVRMNIVIDGILVLKTVKKQ